MEIKTENTQSIGQNSTDENYANQNWQPNIVSENSPKPPQNKLIIILVIVLLVLLGLTVFFGYKYYQLSSLTKIPDQELIAEKIVPTESPVPSPTLSEAANWETYANQKHKYEISYPKEWTLTDLTDGEQIEIYYQPDKTKTVGSILIESISPSLYESSLNSIASPVEKTIGGIKATCQTDSLAKTWCYLFNNEEYFSLLITKVGDKAYDNNLEKIASTFKLDDQDNNFAKTESESKKPVGWISHEFPASNLIIYTPPQWKSSSEDFADASSTLLRFWEAGDQENATIQLNIAPNWDNIGIGNYTIFIVADSIQAYRSDSPKMEEETLDRYQSDFSFERKGKVYSFHCVHNWMEVNIQTCEKMLQTMEFTD